MTHTRNKPCNCRMVGESEFDGRCLSARAAAASRWSLFHVSSIASIAIAVFCASYFGAALVSGAGQ